MAIGALVRVVMRIVVRQAIDAQGKPLEAVEVPDPGRGVRRAVFAGVLILGWLFVLWQNRFHVTAPVVFVCLGFLAVLATVWNLWRTGSAIAADEPTDAWTRPLGARDELDKEKKTLLKAIKEAEFDFEMGKLSRADADAMIATYRARAIEVIKELERLEGTGQLDPYGRPVGDHRETVRARIAREVKARIELDAGKRKAKAKAPKGATP